MQNLLFLSTCLLFAAGISYAGGTWVDTSFVPPSLGFDNPLTVYLPEGYDPEGSTEYPVAYWLHPWTYHWFNGKVFHATVLDSLISNGDIQPLIFVQPDGYCDPYKGSVWANSVLYGNYEDYVYDDLVAFIDSSFCTIADPDFRCIAGASGGGLGSLDIALRHPELYNAVASMAGLIDTQLATTMWIPIVTSQSPEPTPPYTYDWGNGFHTDAFFAASGAYSPNLAAPDSIDFIYDSNGEVVDSVYALWELHNPTHMVKLMALPIDLNIFFGCGTNDWIVSIYECHCSFADTLDSLEIDYIFHTDSGDHGTTWGRMEAALLFMDSCMYNTGIDEVFLTPVNVSLLPAYPNPFSTSTTITFVLPETSNVRLDVYDIAGRLVTRLADNIIASGEHSFVLDAADMNSGVYFYRLETNIASETGRCIKL